MDIQQYLLNKCLIFLGSKITADGDHRHEIKRCLLLGRKAMTNLDSILKSRDITLPTKVHLVKPMVFCFCFFFFPVFMYGCENWTIKKAECWRLMLLNCGVGKDSWESLGLQGDQTKSILQEISPGYSLEELMLKLKLKLQYFGHLMWRADSLEKTLMLGGIWGQEEKWVTEDEMIGWYHWLNGHEFEQALGDGEGQGRLVLQSMVSQRIRHDWATEQWQ